MAARIYVIAVITVVLECFLNGAKVQIVVFGLIALGLLVDQAAKLPK